MLFIGHCQSVSWRSFVRVGVVSILLCLVSTWLLSDLYILPLTSGAKGKLFSDSSFDASLLSASISPFQKKLLPFSNVLKLQLPPHCAQRWALIHEVFTDHNPGSPLRTSVENAHRRQFYAESWETCERPDIVNLESQHVIRAQKKHSAILKQLPALARAFAFPKKSRGIVTSADGGLMPILLVSMRLLRRTGCTLPVEVFIANIGGYEPKLCEKVLPSLNAKCVMLADDCWTYPQPKASRTWHRTK